MVLIRVFRGRKKFLTTYAIVLFFSRSFTEKFKFLKNCPHDFHRILHSHSTHKGAPMCAMTSKSYDCDLRIKAKFSLKMTKKRLFGLFQFSQKLSKRFEHFLQSYYTILEWILCVQWN